MREIARLWVPSRNPPFGPPFGRRPSVHNLRFPAAAGASRSAAAPLAVLALLAGSAGLIAGCDESALGIGSARSAGAPEYEGDDPLAPPDDGGGGADDDAAADDDGASSGDDDETPGSPYGIIFMEPEPDSAGHHYRDPLRFVFDRPSGGAGVTLFDASGSIVPTFDSWNETLDELIVTPAQWLLPAASYSVAIDFGGSGAWAYTFGTSEVGLPVGDAQALDGRSFVLDFSTADAVAPEGLGFLLQEAAGAGIVWIWEFHLSGDSVEPEGLAVDSGVGAPDADGDGFAQDPCAPTRVLGGENGVPWIFSNPYYSSAPAPFSVTLGGQAIAFEDAWVDGDFTPDGAALVKVGFRGFMRASTLQPLLGGEPACDWLQAQLGAACVQCPSGDGDCAWVELDWVSGSATALDLAPVGSEPADEECGDPTAAVLDCSLAGGAGGGPAAALLGALVALSAASRRRGPSP